MSVYEMSQDEIEVCGKISELINRLYNLVKKVGTRKIDSAEIQSEVADMGYQFLLLDNRWGDTSTFEEVIYNLGEAIANGSIWAVDFYRRGSKADDFYFEQQAYGGKVVGWLISEDCYF